MVILFVLGILLTSYLAYVWGFYAGQIANIRVQSKLLQIAVSFLDEETARTFSEAFGTASKLLIASDSKITSLNKASK